MRLFCLQILGADHKPRDKAKVENAVQQVERWGLGPLRDRTFFSIGEANEGLSEKVREINEKVMKGPSCSRQDLFELEEKPAMRPLPDSRYEYAEWKRFKVGPDYHIQAGGHLYSVPFALCGEYVDVKIGAGTVEVFHQNARVASHLRCVGRRGPSTVEEHMPAGHKEHAAWTPTRVVRWAGTVGPNTAAFAERVLSGKVHPEHGFRMCLGLVSLAKSHGDARVEAACAKALSLGAMTYRNVKTILQSGLESAKPPLDLPPLPSHDNVRGGSYYASQEDVCVN